MVNELKTLAELRAKVASNGDRVVAIDIWAPCCGPCVQISPLFDKFASTHGDKIDFFKINLDEAPEIEEGVEEFKGIPTFLFYKNGVEIARVVGSHADELEKTIGEVY